MPINIVAGTRRFMLNLMAKMSPHRLDFCLHAALWITAAVLIGFAIRALASPVNYAGPSRIDLERPQPEVSPDSPQSSQKVVRLYDVHDLVDSCTTFCGSTPPNLSTFFPSATSNNSNQNPQQAAGTGSVPATNPLVAGSPVLMINLLARLITDNVRPEDWATNGGNDGSLGFVDQTLIVTGDASLQRNVAEFLHSLREADANSPVIVRK